MDLSWNTLPRADWERFHRAHDGSMQQAWAYGQAMQRLGVQVHRAAITQEGQLVGLAQFIGKRWLGYISLASCSRGPVWAASATGTLRQQAYRAMQKQMPTRWLRATLFSPEACAADLMPGELQGLSRVMSGHSTAMLDLRQDLGTLRRALEFRWRNKLHRAEKTHAAHVQVGPDLERTLELLLHEKQMRQERGFHGLPVSFVPAYIEAHAQPEQAFILSAVVVKGQMLAGMLFLLHGRAATYHIGWNSAEGRQRGLHNLALWHGLQALQARGIDRLDLGGTNTHDLAGITRFKLGTGGRPITLAGTFF